MSGRVWLITGASRGLGRALVDRVLHVGDTVIATVRGEADFPAHERLVVDHLDVRDRGAARAVVCSVVEKFGRLDVLVDNAGHGAVGAIEETTEQEARDIVDTNFFGALWLSQAAVEVMRPRRSGHIVQISTVGAVGTMPTLGLYAASKWALEAFSEAMAAEVKDFGIRVTLAELGAVDTQWGTGSMRFSAPSPDYDDLRTAVFGAPAVPWPREGTGGGTAPADAAAAIVDHVRSPSDDRLRLLVGDDAPGQVAEALTRRLGDYRRDERFPTTALARSITTPIDYEVTIER
ncbi:MULTISPECIES: SDR family NAD(P)-dependent oxidoreductase [Nocardiaceae]|uniref:NAD(P)-dependent dehydrogenase (Short-subunit alcohol dehydrogenase family) n=1 Tax=Rhodococcoides corynebacterioides TaxID=53972 RepID=A0ABS2KS82_9NOCA|nr:MULTISPECIES: SDR family NAD(P)-dependent oxidoreductase [Rhodococcus]MBM7414819.1 NAD(P)-dependent dehydrogenase (short-subunit alcohol dehydrogenase family) [Rhodococcus corynebacterioides]MBP1117281.1 NAD(P)-dependent dehydrogenase (short-subunit alcohol dehydrogenase family) [Rhodococcus sp. PvP016]